MRSVLPAAVSQKKPPVMTMSSMKLPERPRSRFTTLFPTMKKSGIWQVPQALHWSEIPVSRPPAGCAPAGGLQASAALAASGNRNIARGERMAMRFLSIALWYTKSG